MLAVWVTAAIAGVGKNTVFNNPQSMSDGELERTIRLSQRIMDNSPVGSKEWSEAGDKFQRLLRSNGGVRDCRLSTGTPTKAADRLCCFSLTFQLFSGILYVRG